MPDQRSLRYSDAELLEFKALIEQKLEKARREMQYLNGQILEMQENIIGLGGGDISDGSSRHSEVELLTDMVSRQQQFIRNLENALLRIRNKTYGICTVTGQLIAKQRLMLVPHATKSVAGKQQVSGGKSEKVKSPVKSKISNSQKVISRVISRPASRKKGEHPSPEEWDKEDILDQFDEEILELESEDMPEEDLKDENL